MNWAYEISPEAARQLRDLGPSTAADIKRFLEQRVKGSADPTAFGKALRGDLKGYWRYRVTDYRILCRIEHHRVVVVVISVGYRSGVYED
ncbi:MAG: type II toxin-antitoxin system RelE/ParE family toxin [Verrucomicrobia bacterium]|nr:type II toxin-antitoxin system RelE/ParE family toxin [Verrucomicrobiota bacterium]